MAEYGALMEFREAEKEMFVHFSEVALANAMLAALEAIKHGALSPKDADNAFTGLDVELTERADRPELSEEAQELIFEGEHLHHCDAAYGPDLSYLTRLAFTILDRHKVSTTI